MQDRPFSRRNPEKRRRESRITIPEHCGPHVKLAFSEMARQRVRYEEVEERSGVLRATIKAWRRKNTPGLISLEAVFGFLGWRLVPVPTSRVLPPTLVAELEPIASRLSLTMPQTIEALVEIASRSPATAALVAA